jgi:hypothetical protein
MRTFLLLATAAVPTLPACFQLEASARAGYASMAVDGNFGYVSAAPAVAIGQDIQSGFGLGEDQGAPYGRVELDTGVQVFSVSGFAFAESGNGVLQADFGGTLTAGTPVHSDLEMFTVKATYAFEIPLGPVSLSPGIAIDWFDLRVDVTDTSGTNSESVDLSLPIPLAFLRTEVDLGLFSAMAEVGYMAADVDNVDTSFLDIEAMLLLHPTPLLDFFVGYRGLEIDVKGTVDGDEVDTDLRFRGWMVGGGVRF